VPKVDRVDQTIHLEMTIDLMLSSQVRPSILMTK